MDEWQLYAKEVPVKGRGVFPGVRIPANRIVLKFEGPIYTKETCPDFSEAIQVGLNAWMWSSGGLDDLVNHSCAPNTGLLSRGGHTYLLSLRDIEAGEELSFDYSTSMVDEPWSMECGCGEKTCRGVIANFLDMPKETQHYYARKGVLPDHVVAAARARSVSLPTSSSVPGGSDSPVPVRAECEKDAAAELPSLVPATA